MNIHSLCLALTALQLCRVHEAAYIFVSQTQGTYAAAEADCVATYSGHLATILSAADNAAVLAKCEDIGQIWGACMLGLDNSATITHWADGTAVSYTNWFDASHGGTEPDGTGSTQPMVHMRQDGLWHTGGNTALPYVCEGTSQNPTASPSTNPTGLSSAPTAPPTLRPSDNPSASPSKSPSFTPTVSPSNNPTAETSPPTLRPTDNPTVSPSNNPSISPSQPTAEPSNNPSVSPSKSPSDNPTVSPSNNPTASPSNNPSESPTQSPVQKTCTKNTNYVIDGQMCTVDGDPHFTTFGGRRHDFQGQPSTGKSQFYYVTTCDGELADDMPFSIIGKHERWQTRSVTGLDYLTFELLDDTGTEYLLFLSSGIHEFVEKTTGVTTLYDDNVAATTVTMTSITADTATAIGNRFSISYTQVSTKRIDAVLTIDGSCTVEFWMEGQTYFNSRWRMHRLYLAPPACYRCFICGLCGDFKRTPSSALETCDGGSVTIQSGWGSTNAFAWDTTGNTWEVSGCNRRRRRLQSSSTQYVPNIGSSFTYVPPCDSSIEADVIAACQTARDAAAICCGAITEFGGTFCDELQDSCEVDACAASGTDTTVIDTNVEEIFTDAVNLVCAIPNVATFFASVLTVATVVLPQYQFPTTYIFVNEPKTYADAEADCAATYGGHLASIHSVADNDAVTAACLDVSQLQGACLIGLDNTALTAWSDGTPIDYTNWLSHPDGGAAQPHVTIRQDGWWHTGGASLAPYVCEGTTSTPTESPTPSPTAPKYFTDTSSTGGTWADAQAFCQGQGATLASIHSVDDFNAAKAECNALIGVKGNSYGCWIGLNNNELTYKDWVWSDGTASDFGFTNSDPAQPTEYTFPWYSGAAQPSEYGVGSCVVMYTMDSINQWIARDCNYDPNAYPICNYETSDPTVSPTKSPTSNPTMSPTFSTDAPTTEPTTVPTADPTEEVAAETTQVEDDDTTTAEGDGPDESTAAVTSVICGVIASVLLAILKI